MMVSFHPRRNGKICDVIATCGTQTVVTLHPWICRNVLQIIRRNMQTLLCASVGRNVRRVGALWIFPYLEVCNSTEGMLTQVSLHNEQ